MKPRESYKWSNLRHNDLVDVIAPGSAATIQQTDDALKFLERSGFIPRVPQQMYAPDLFVSNSDEARASHLISSLHDLKSKAIWSVRNGYGSNRIAPYLVKINAPKKIKVFIASSDATPLHIILNQMWRWPTLWGPPLDRASHPKFPASTVNELGAILAGKLTEVSFKLQGLNSLANFSELFQGPLVGGTLSGICSTLGTPWQINSEGCILFIEEVGLRAHRIDSLLEQLHNANLISKAKAIVFGNFSKCEEPDGNPLWMQVIDRFSQKFDIPIVFGLQSSNTLHDRIIPLGCQATLQTGPSVKMVCQTNGSLMGEGTFNSSFSNVA